MNALIQPGATLELLYTGTAWGEGPVWLADSASLRWSDIPNDRILQYDSLTGRVEVYRERVEYTNGRTLDLDGTVLQCCHGRRLVEREIDGEPVTVVDNWAGKRLNSPNDLVVQSDGSIWFTDPPYGILSDDEGHKDEPEYDGCYVFRFDERTGALDPVITDMMYPNGLAFSPDESILYVSDTGHQEHPHIRAYDLVDGECRNGRDFAQTDGPTDGFRVDELGRIWTSSGSSVQVLDPNGRTLERIPVPERVANLCFGGADGSDLYITATSGLYRIRTTTRAASRPA